LQELVEADRSNRPHSNHKLLSNHRHNQLLMEAVEVVVEEEEEAAVAVEVDQHPLQEAQPPNKQQHPKQDQMVP